MLNITILPKFKNNLKKNSHNTAPTIGNKNPAPTLARTSLMGRMNPEGAPLEMVVGLTCHFPTSTDYLFPNFNLPFNAGS
jgi:hypothetical protein